MVHFGPLLNTRPEARKHDHDEEASEEGRHDGDRRVPCVSGQQRAERLRAFLLKKLRAKAQDTLPITHNFDGPPFHPRRSSLLAAFTHRIPQIIIGIARSVQKIPASSRKATAEMICRRHRGASSASASSAATHLHLSPTFLVLLLSAIVLHVQGRLSSSISSTSSGTFLTDEHIQSILSFDPSNPPQRPRSLQSSSAAADAKCRPLRIDEWLNLLQSETNSEFDLTEEIVTATTAAADSGGNSINPSTLLARAQLMWEDATEFEWDRSYQATVDHSRPSPFVVCVERPRGETITSGYRRRKLIRNHIRSVIYDMENDGSDVAYRQVIMRTLYNGEDMFCSYALLDAVVAQGLDFEGCAVQPMLMSMKLMPRTVDTLLEKAEECREQIENDNRQRRRDQQSVLDLLLGGEEDNDGGSSQQTQGQEPENNSEFENLPDCDALDLRRPAADILLCPGSLSFNQVQALQDGDPSYLVASLTSKKGSNTPSISEQVYWTSSAANGYRRMESARAEFWRKALEQAGTEYCDYVFWKKLTWSIREGDNDDDFSVLRVVYEASMAEARESGCVASLIAGLAVRQDVCGLEIVADADLNNYNANWMVQSGVPDETPWHDVGLDGAGQVVALSDTGIDTRNCYFYDADFDRPSDNLDAYGHRKIAMYWPYADDQDEELGHGTHTAAIIAGKRAPDGINEEPGVANGIAPAAKLAFIDISSTVGKLDPPSDNEVLSTGRGRNDYRSPTAAVHSMSWGSKNVFYYNNQCRMFDNYMFQNDDFLAVVAAGNEGLNDRETSVGAPGNAKNVLSVGASHSFGDELEQGQLGPSYIADFSSRGPTKDGRIAPDVVAPGKFIVSAAARPNNPGACDPSNDDVPGPSQNIDGLYSQAGSSMSAPLVAGTAALIRQYFEEGWHGNGSKDSASFLSPSGALVKAVIMNGAQADMKGVDNGSRGTTTVKPYDNNQGFGRVSLTDSLYIAGKTDVQFKFWDQETLFDGDAAKTYDVTIDKSRGCDASLSVTLAWIEEGSPPGCSKCLLNDLDLYIEGGRESVRYHPNGRSVRDDVNNVERIVIDSVSDGSRFTIHVEPYNLDSLSQKYALVATGCFGGVANEINTAQDIFSEDLAVRSGDNGGDSSNTTTIIIIVCASCGGVILLCLGLACFRKYRQEDKHKEGKQMHHSTPPKRGKQMQKTSPSKKRKHKQTAPPRPVEPVDLRRGRTG